MPSTDPGAGIPLTFVITNAEVGSSVSVSLTRMSPLTVVVPPSSTTLLLSGFATGGVFGHVPVEVDRVCGTNGIGDGNRDGKYAWYCRRAGHLSADRIDRQSWRQRACIVKRDAVTAVDVDHSKLPSTVPIGLFIGIALIDWVDRLGESLAPLMSIVNVAVSVSPVGSWIV